MRLHLVSDLKKSLILRRLASLDRDLYWVEITVLVTG